MLGGTVAEAYEVDPAAAYGAQADVPWYASGHLLATSPYIDGSWAGAGTTSCAHWFDGSALTSATYAFNGCPRLVGGHDCYVPAYTDKASVCHTGAGGAFTDPADDNRTWVRGRLYADWQAEVSLGAAQAGREVASEWRLCAAARYRATAAMPWNAQRTKVASARIADDMAQAPCPSIAYWFYGLSAVTSFEGLANLKGLESMRYAFTGCSALEELDLRGLDPAALQDLFYTFGSCGSLRTITVDAGWELPAGASGTNAFYSCKALVGGAGSAFDSSRTSAVYMRIDGGEGAEGYLTAS